MRPLMLRASRVSAGRSRAQAENRLPWRQEEGIARPSGQEGDLRVGLPLTVIIALVSAWMARWLWLGGPLLPHFGG